ncbi:MAG TPA: DUF4388 domain-containing protein [Chthoniobacter sp.]|nr:DUF4388 domain-containing protein [Chthoniobacter sp.]
MSSAAMLAHKGFEGVIQGATLADLIQMECLALSTRAVRVDGAGTSGRLFFTGGQVVHAELGELKGELALFEMLRWATGSFTVEEGVRPMDETIQRDWHNLLLEAAHHADEVAHASPSIPMVPLPAPKTAADVMNEAFNDPEIIQAAHFTEDGTLLAGKGTDPESLQCTFAYVVQLLRHVGTSLGAENLKEINLLAPEQKALCLVGDKDTTVMITTAKANFANITKKLA